MSELDAYRTGKSATAYQWEVGRETTARGNHGRVAVRGAEPRPLFAFAGLWRRHVGSINHERMPVLLSTEAEFETWITRTPNEAFALVGEHPPDKMRMVQSGFEKRDLRLV